jgi:lysozyme family protein
VFDVAVLHGPGKAREFLRRALGLDPKGKIDDKVLSTLEHHDNWDNVVREICNLRRKHYDAIIARNPSQIKYKKGWYARTARVEALACEMAPDSTTKRGAQPTQLVDAGRPDETVEIQSDQKPAVESTTVQAGGVTTLASVYSTQAVLKAELAAASTPTGIAWGRLTVGLLTSEVFIASMVAVIGALYVIWHRAGKDDVSGWFRSKT